MILYLGTHETSWLSRTQHPLFISRVRLARRRSLPRATCPWALDSGGFSELSLRGRWTVTAEEYAAEVTRWQEEIGGLAWAAVQDWMCEPHVRERTGKTTPEHQRLTVESLLDLRSLAPGVPWVPVLQGWEYRDYFEHLDLYQSAGIDLAAEPLVGVGSVCRRQNTRDVPRLLAALHAAGIRLHGFGLKLTALRACSHTMNSADSMAWSYNARRHPPLKGHAHKSCANCLEWATRWRSRVLAATAQHQQMYLPSALGGGCVLRQAGRRA